MVCWRGSWGRRGRGSIMGPSCSGGVSQAAEPLSEGDYERLAVAAAEESQEMFIEALEELWKPRPDAGVVVTASSERDSQQVVTNEEGRFVFDALPPGVYDVWAEMPGAREGDEPLMSSAATRVRVVESSAVVRLELHDELITITGRVTDEEGRPIAGAQVTGTPVPFLETGQIFDITATTDAEGRYVLGGYGPVGVYRTAGYLNGGSLEADGALYTLVEIRVEAEGFEQSRENMPKVPLIAERQLRQGRRFWHFFAKLAARAEGEGKGWEEIKERDLPRCEGSTIMDIDIRLKMKAL